MHKEISGSLPIFALIFVFITTFFFAVQCGSQETQSISNKQIESYLIEIKNYTRNKNYEEAIDLAKELITLAPEDTRGYTKLRALYVLTEEYENALTIGEKEIALLEKKGRSICGDIMIQAEIYEYKGDQNRAIDYLERYREQCPEVVDKLINGLQKAIADRTNFFPQPPLN